ncbi:acyl carrier protein [bacterium]|nr:acyl carrier protein [candidate division CSSED10-310 bacterium]
MDIEKKVIDIVAETLSLDKDQIKPESSFTEHLGADSLEIVSLVMAFEENFSIEIPDADVENKIVTVGDAVAYLKSRLGE